MDKNTWSNPTSNKKFDTAEDVQVLINDINEKFSNEKLLNIDLSGNTFGIEASQALAACLAKHDEIEVIKKKKKKKKILNNFILYKENI